jgi:hypothetical protein
MSSKKGDNQDYAANSSSDTASTNSSGSSSDKATPASLMKIEDLPTFDLAKIEFLEKLGEGKLAKSYNLGAFGKVRLGKIIKGGGFQGGSSGNKSAPIKAAAVFKSANQNA